MVLKVAVVLFVIGLGSKVCASRQLRGSNWHEFAPFGFSGIGAAAAYIFFAYIGFDAVSTTAQEAKNPQRDLPIGMTIASLFVCTILYIGVAAVLTGMVPWNSGQHRGSAGASVSRSRADLGLGHHRRRCAGRSDLGDAGDAPGADARALCDGFGRPAAEEVLRRGFILGFRTPFKNTFLVGTLAGVVGSVTPIDDIGKMVNIGTLLAFVIVCMSIIVLRRSDPDARGRSGPLGSVRPDHGHPCQWLHDDQAGLAELGSFDRLAADWAGGVLHLQRKEQQGTAGGCRTPSVRRGSLPSYRIGFAKSSIQMISALDLLMRDGPGISPGPSFFPIPVYEMGRN